MHNSTTFQLPQPVIGWLLDSDPALQWQVRKDLLHEPAESYEAIRKKIPYEGLGKLVLDAQQDDGSWAGVAWNRDANATIHALTLLYLFGVEPADPRMQAALASVRDNVFWSDDPRFAGNPYFEGEIEACINGNTATAAIYFRQDVAVLMGKLLEAQKDDGGWNCDEDSLVSSFNSTICVLEALQQYEQTFGEDQNVQAARSRGEDYLLTRHLFKRLSTGQTISRDNWYKPLGDNPAFTALGFPYWSHYDILRGLDYFRREDRFDPGLEDSVALLQEKQQTDGFWLTEVDYGGEKLVSLDEKEGEPSKWLTFKAALVLEWYQANVARRDSASTRVGA